MYTPPSLNSIASKDIFKSYGHRLLAAPCMCYHARHISRHALFMCCHAPHTCYHTPHIHRHALCMCSYASCTSCQAPCMFLQVPCMFRQAACSIRFTLSSHRLHNSSTEMRSVQSPDYLRIEQANSDFMSRVSSRVRSTGEDQNYVHNAVHQSKFKDPTSLI